MAKRPGKQIAVINPKRHVVQKNPIIESGYKIAERAERLLRIIISQIDDKRDEDFHVYHFETSALYEALGLNSTHTQTTDLEKAINELMDVKIRIPEHLSEDGSITLTRILQKGKIHRRENWTTLQIDDDLKPFYLQIKEKYFTKYALGEVLSFRGEYTLRMFEWFIEERFTASSKSGAWYVTLPLQEIRFRLGMLGENGEPTMYQRWPDFRRRVVDAVVEEVSEKSTYTVSYETVTHKRKVTDIKFHVVPKKTAKNTAEAKPVPVTGSKPKKEIDDSEKRLRVLEAMAKKCGDDLRSEIQSFQADEMKKLRAQSRNMLSEEMAERRALDLALEHFEDEIRKETEGRKKGE
jgi:plasmid replication initiation protein